MDLVWRAQGIVRAAAAPSMPGADNSASQLARADSLLSVAEYDAPNWVVPTLQRAWLARLAGSLRSGDARVRALEVGLGHAERAVARYPSAAVDGRATVVRAGEAEAYWVRGQLRTDAATAVQTYRREDALLRGAEADLLTATSIDSVLAGAWASLGMLRWVRGDNPGAILATQRALALDGYLENADRIIDYAVRALIALADRRAALTWCQRGRRMFPADWRYVECELSVMYIDAGGGGERPDPVRAWALVDTLGRMDPDSVAAASGRPYSPIYRRMVAAIVSAAGGDTARARREYAVAEARVRQSAELANDLRFDAAHLAFVLGDSVTGEARLTEYVRARPDLAALVRNDRTTAQFRRVPARRGDPVIPSGTFRADAERAGGHRAQRSRAFRALTIASPANASGVLSSPSSESPESTPMRLRRSPVTAKNGEETPISPTERGQVQRAEHILARHDGPILHELRACHQRGCSTARRTSRTRRWSRRHNHTPRARWACECHRDETAPPVDCSQW